jgi:hypothetical protein
MEEAQIAPVELVESGEDATVVLDLADETLHKMTLSVKMYIVLVGLVTV